MNDLAQLTRLLSLLGLALSLWLGCYIVVRSPRSRLAWLAGLTLGSLAGVFFDTLVADSSSPFTAWWFGWPLNLPIAIWYHLSLETLPAAEAKPQRRWLLATYLLAAGADVLLGLTSLIVRDPLHGFGPTFKVFTFGPLIFLLPVAPIGLSLLMLFNFWRARRAAASTPLRQQLEGLVRSTLFETLGILYGVVAVLFGQAWPTWPMLAALLLGIILLGYGIIRYSTLIEGRILRYDFVFSGLLIGLMILIYITLMTGAQMPFEIQIIVIAIVILTHSGFDFVRRLLDSLFLHRPERALRAVLRDVAIEIGERDTLDEGLRHALAAVVTAVGARWGCVVFQIDEAFIVQASFRSLDVGDQVPLDIRHLRHLAPPTTAPAALADLALIGPLIADDETLGALLLGPPGNGSIYGDRDRDLIADALDTLTDLIQDSRLQDLHVQEIEQVLMTYQARERQLQSEIDSLRQPIAVDEPDSNRLAAVEDVLRHLSDYSYLGEHPLAGAMPAAPHLERGKALHATLIAIIEQLRPTGVAPRELPTREWHPYLILHDAYVDGKANRDIMARLYISEATFHRTRRRALRALAKTLFEPAA